LLEQHSPLSGVAWHWESQDHDSTHCSSLQRSIGLVAASSCSAVAGTR
jgi:hypothetical protein